MSHEKNTTSARTGTAATATKSVSAGIAALDAVPNALNVRHPARAGQFYPAEPETMNRDIDKYLAAANGGNKAVRRAIMLPHAGWIYCGETIGKTLHRTIVPNTAIIIGPKHTPHGEAWSIASHDAWDIPGARVPIASELVHFLIEHTSSPLLHREPEAHRLEHGSEVLIPFLHRLNPALSVVPIVIGTADYESTRPLAKALAELYHRAENKPLLVISSDMNHFAPEPENQRLDFMALNAMRTGDPEKLYDTCIKHEISMCGFLPACITMQALLELTPSLKPELVDYSNSAKASSDTSRVVGYAGVLLD